MKKVIPILTCLWLLFALTGCQRENALAIESYTWNMRFAAYGTEDPQNVVAVGQEDPAYPNADRLTVTLTARNGTLTVTDCSTEKTYTGSYTAESKNRDGIIYRITVNETVGFATVSYTADTDGRRMPTCPVRIGEWSIYFYADS